MSSLIKTVHVVAVGLWFGSVVFFTASGVLISRAFEEEARKPAGKREPWFPVPPEYRRTVPDAGLPDPLVLEQGSRAFGVAVGKVFPFFYSLQAVCGLVALGTALAWAGSGRRLDRARVVLLFVALLTVGVGWWLERVVHDLRETRNTATDALLKSESPSEHQVEKVKELRADFARWHGYSLIDNFTTLFLVSVAMALAAHMPPRPGQPLAA
jgi:acyl phosphate:glycerol-3-phosphate acyltransferase